MRSSDQRAVWVVLGLLALAGLSRQAMMGAWVRLSGAVVAYGSSFHGYADKPVRLLSAVGHRRGESYGPTVAAYHVLVLFPSASLTDIDRVSGGDNTREYAIAQRWRVETVRNGARLATERQVEARYDAVWRMVTLEGRRYRLANGNLFVVRLGEHGGAEVTQLDATVPRVEEEAVLPAYRALLRHDAAALRILDGLYRYDPARRPGCGKKPPRAAGALPGSTA